MYNLSSICFMCLVNNKNLTTLYHTDAEYITTQQLKYVLPEITFSELGIPVHICSGCHSALQSFHEFKTKCLDSFYRLKDYIKTTQGTSHDQQMKCAENNNDRLTEQQSDVEFKEETEDPLLSLERRADVQNFAPESVNIKEEIIESESDYSIEEGCHPFQFVKCEEGEPSNISRNDTQNEAEFFADSEVKEFQCTICDKKFTRSGYLKQHMRSIHTVISQLREEKMESASEEDLDLKPPNITIVKITSLNSLPDISRRKYEQSYKVFMDWLKDQKTASYSENVLLKYFLKISEQYKASTLWTQYSMLRATLKINDNVDLSQYEKLRAFLKRQSTGYTPKKSKIFTTADIEKFIEEAPDEIYLLMKVAFILGVAGALHRHELHALTTNQLKDLGSAVVVTIPESRTKLARSFTVTGRFYEIFKRYASLRPLHVNHNSFFINYQKEKCTIQRVGIHKFGAMGKQIAKYLNLPNPELYTGHCFRRSATLDS